MEEGEARAYVLEDGEEVLMTHLGPGEMQHNSKVVGFCCAKYDDQQRARVNFVFRLLLSCVVSYLF